jgi:hypothetical protein
VALPQSPKTLPRFIGFVVQSRAVAIQNFVLSRNSDSRFWLSDLVSRQIREKPEAEGKREARHRYCLDETSGLQPQGQRY